MKSFAATALAALLGVLLVFAGGFANTQPESESASSGTTFAMAGSSGSSPLAVDMASRDLGERDPLPASASGVDAKDIDYEALTGVVRRYCTVCHNDQLETGNLSLQTFDVARAIDQPETAEKMIAKLRAEMMPPPDIPRPSGDTLVVLAETLEDLIDEGAANNPGYRSFQRLNRAEYERSVRELLGLEVDAGQWLPLDMRMANFDNIVDVQLMSPTVLNSFLTAASEISRLAVGDVNASRRQATYTNSGYLSQWERVDGAPYGTRGGMSVVHNFPADGEYVFNMSFENTTTGGVYGGITRFEQLEISVNGEPVVVMDFDQWMHVSDPDGTTMRTEPISVEAGPQRISAAFRKQSDAVLEDLVSPHDWSIADRQIGVRGYGVTALPHLKDLIIDGPHSTTGVSETPVRERIFTCRPSDSSEERACAEQILSGLATEAYRRPVTDGEVERLLDFYEEGAEASDFEEGVRMGLQAILASPDFVFRMEREPEGVQAGEVYAVSDLDLASRMSFFLWSLPPDRELIELAREGRLSDPAVLEEQARRMLEDPRAEALATRFAAQWLRLHDLDGIDPDAFWYPDFDEQLRHAMRRETELFFHHLVQEDRSFLELYEADYTFVNERLARHYGIRDVRGDEFRRVEYPEDSRRRGIFGHGSILTSTSHANRTSPTDRGKWVMEVVLGTPPPPPPPVPALEETASSEDGRRLTTRERIEMHAANPTCNACHQFMDPIGLALDNFDVTGSWRIRERDLPLDTRGQLYDGTPVSSPGELVDALLARPVPLVRSFTENLLTYALGRRVEWYDKPAVRTITDRAAANDYRMSEFILGVVGSEAFRMQRAGGPLAEVEDHR